MKNDLIYGDTDRVTGQRKGQAPPQNSKVSMYHLTAGEGRWRRCIY